MRVTPSTSVAEYSNVWSFTIPVTENLPLYPVSSNPPVLVVLLTLKILTKLPMFSWCGISAVTVTIPALPAIHVLINLGFLSKSWSVAAPILTLVESASFLNAVELDSCMINVSAGSFALSASFGTTILTLYNFSSKLLESSTLSRKVLSDVAVKTETPFVFNAL